MILAAGCGVRMGSDTPKHLMRLCGDTVLRHTVRAFERADSIDSITVVCQPEYIELIKGQMRDFGKVVGVVAGGATRMESARLGFSSIPDIADFVAIHDAARCLVTQDMINAVVAEAVSHGAATAGSPVYDTVKLAEDGDIVSTVPRERLFLAQTPQVFSCSLYEKALSFEDGADSITDDNGLLERMGARIRCVNTGPVNIKITTRPDLEYAEFVLSKRGAK